MQKKSFASKAIWVSIIGGLLTGMGNGSVFGAAVMCLVGRGSFNDWGGWGMTAYDPSTFTGFIDIAMIVFGIAYIFIVMAGLKAHEKLENAGA
jgi:hypothetical protein